MAATKQRLRKENMVLRQENDKLRVIIRKIADFAIKLPDDLETLQDAIARRLEAMDDEETSDQSEHASNNSGA